MRLTDGTVAKLAAPDKEAIFFDEDVPGFGLRMRTGKEHSFSRTWIFQYKLGSQHRRMTLGKHPAIPAVKAREIAAKLYAEVKLGNDPQGAKEAKRQHASETFDKVVQEYLASRRGEMRESSYGEVERHLLRNLRPLHGLHIAKVDLRAIATQLTRITRDNGPAQANRTRESLVAFLNWCARQGYVENNAAAFSHRNKEVPRDRVLSDDELKAIWNALPDSDYGAILKLLILSGQRANEIARLRWSEIKDGKIVLPKQRVKNGREHIIPISAQIQEILDARAKRDDRDFVFGEGRNGFSGWSHCKIRLDEAVKLPEWIIHDIRRSVATGMASIGILPHIVEAVLNHISGHKAGIAGTYNRSQYPAEKANALARWGEYMEDLVTGRKSKITALRA
jgi:integrase